MRTSPSHPSDRVGDVAAPAAPLALDRSEELLRRGSAVDATLSAEGYVLPRDRVVVGEYPSFGERGEGAYVWDVDGNRYLDFILAYGTIVLGHAHPAVSAAVIAEIERGFALGVRKQAQVELGELLTEVIPGAEQVLLLKTGSDATSAAVRIARAHTGRERVVRWGYAGWHDWAALRPAGVPRPVRDQMHAFTYNDVDSLEQIFAAHGEEIACCVMMPFELEAPAPGFLAAVAGLVRRHGALLVFDEMRSGFRVDLGGAQERLGVRADLATFSKAMANGYPISAVTGPERIMRQVGEVHISSTFYVNAAEMAAALATIRELRRGEALPRIERLGERLLAGLDAAASAAGVPARTRGVAQMPFLEFTYEDERSRELAKSAFFTETIRRGVLLHPNHHWYISAAMDEGDIDEALAACEVGFAAVRAAVAR
jgi:glutamate-1-semialdehyde aminotransferase